MKEIGKVLETTKKDKLRALDLANDVQFELHAILNTERRDQVFKSLFGNLKEVKELLTDNEELNDKQQKEINEVMTVINVGGGMCPD